jgi:excinuclease ABC subunit A
MDEPTTGLHLEDIRKLAEVMDRLVDAGHTLVLIEHNLDVIKLADWVIDLGPDAGDRGGEIVAMGRPEEIMAEPLSHTGRFLRRVLTDGARAPAATELPVPPNRPRARRARAS